MYIGIRSLRRLVTAAGTLDEQGFRIVYLVMLVLTVLAILVILYLNHRQKESDRMAEEIVEDCRTTTDDKDRYGNHI